MPIYIISIPSIFPFSGILADLQAIYIRTFYDPFTVTVRNFQLKSAAEAIEGDGRSPVSYVEQCTCDSAQNVAGKYCEHLLKRKRK